MKNNKERICPVERAYHLDNRIRRWFQNPPKILKPYLREGMAVLDLGCGPGFFTLDMAHMVGSSGRVIASDLQDGMLEKLKTKIQGTSIENRIMFHQCKEDQIGLKEVVDFIFAFYMVHEVPNVEAFFSEIAASLKPDGQVFMVEPPFHVSKKGFEKTIEKANSAGFTVVERPKLFLNKAAIFEKD